MGFLEGFYYVPRIDREILAEHKEGLICLFGREEGVEDLAVLRVLRRIDRGGMHEEPKAGSNRKIVPVSRASPP